MPQALDITQSTAIAAYSDYQHEAPDTLDVTKFRLTDGGNPRTIFKNKSCISGT